MKKMYIKPVCETENILTVSILAASNVDGLTTTVGDQPGPGFGGAGDPSDDPDVKAENFWE
jgi:hypothetical protein